MRRAFGSGPFQPRRWTLGDLVARHGGVLFELATGRRVSVERATAIPSDVHLASGRVAAGDIFVARKGLRADGARFIPDAVRRGVGAVLVSVSRSPEVLARRCRTAGVDPGAALVWLHPRVDRVLAEVAADVHGRPADSLSLAGVTGTNGKTSVAHMTAQVLRSAGLAPAVLGTAGHTLESSRGPLQVASTHTTPDAAELSRLFARHVAGGGRTGVLEVSSHGLVQGRLEGLNLRVGAFTNLTREHLDYHGSMARYAEAKARIWDHLTPDGVAVIHGVDPAALAMREAALARGARIVSVAVEGPADLQASGLSETARGMEFTLSGMGLGRRRLHLPLAGTHNVENAVVAAGIARAMGVGGDDLVGALSAVVAAPGRLEPIEVPARLANEDGHRMEVYVDYAHTPDAMERVLGSLRARCEGSQRLLVVFGTGGDRDQGKRRPMGEAAGRLAHVSFVTSDNPRSEDPAAIADQILAGVDAVSGRRIVELDRRTAIERAIGMARPGDVVLIAGKGHENLQLVGDQTLPFDDRVVAAETLDALAAGGPA